MRIQTTQISFISLVSFFFFCIPFFISADVEGNQKLFFVDSKTEQKERSYIFASLQKVTNTLYFYIEDEWWGSLDQNQRDEILKALGELDASFEKEIYPRLVAVFGAEQRPGIDSDNHITILIHPMKSKSKGGYFIPANLYTKFESPQSNEREMVYLRAEEITSPLLKSNLAHEFTHLLYFSQKKALRVLSNETWIEEGIAELGPVLVGYDENGEGSYGAKRVRLFIASPRDSLTEWLDLPSDYGVAYVFFQYVRDQYGNKVLSDIANSRKIGVAAIEEALAKNGYKESFSGVFTNWTIAVFVNDCSYGERYCFKKESLKNLRIPALTSYLFSFGESQLTVTNQTTNWAGNWHKISGGREILEIKFQGNPGVTFRLPYLIQKKTGQYEIAFASLNDQEEGTVLVQDFGGENIAAIIIPSIQWKTSDFTDSDFSYLFSWTASTREEGSQDNFEQESIKKMLLQIEELKAEIARLEKQLAILKGEEQVNCGTFEQDLSFGMRDSGEVRCLQKFLKEQGGEIYLEGLVTGNFFELTQRAVVRFQEKYAGEILVPVGLGKGTGFVGVYTRKKMNELLGLDKNP